jgi:hypothetical protein
VAESRRRKSVVLAPVGDWWYVKSGASSTDVCPLEDHWPNCIYFCGTWQYSGEGEWRLKNPIDASKIGQDVVLEEVYVDALATYDWGCRVWWDYRELAVYAGGTCIWKVEGERITHGDRQWVTNKYVVGKPVSGLIDVKLWNSIRAWTAAFCHHYRNVTLVFSYTPSTPPQPATLAVRVEDARTGSPLAGARAALLSGATVVAEGFTGSDGLATLKLDVDPEGEQFTLDVSKPGYKRASTPVTVKPGASQILVRLEPAPLLEQAEPYLPYVAAGLGAAVAGYAAYTLARRRRE